MNLQRYQELTGKTLSDSEKVTVKSQIRRNLHRLETLLGYTLDPNKTNTNIYNEMGKAQTDLFWSYPDVDISNHLNPPDEVVGAYRLYHWNDNDKFLHVDPFTSVYNVKLVYIKKGYMDESGVTIQTFTSDEIRPQYGQDGIGKYIERIKPWIYHFQFPRHHVQLAVDADWLWPNCIPVELEWLLIDMVEFYMDAKNNVQSEIIEGHRYTKYDRLTPENEPANQAFLRKYAGPHGTASRAVTL